MIDATAAIEAQDEVGRRLVELGWAQPESASPNPLLRYAFYLPGSADILPATWLMPIIEENNSQAQVGVAALLGFECPAARELSTALLGRAHAGAVLRRPQLSTPPLEGGWSALEIEAIVGFIVEQKAALSSVGMDRLIEMLQSNEALPATNRQRLYWSETWPSKSQLSAKA